MTSEALALHGTAQVPPKARRLAAGPLSLELENGAIRYVRHSGFEAIRGIDYLLRDASWRTPPAALAERLWREEADGFHVILDGEVRQDDIHYRYTLDIKGSADGTLEVVAEGEALTGFLTNRTGFVVLHPIKGVAGAPVSVTHKDGGTSETTFPALISPGQPIFDIRALRHEVAQGLFVTCRMEAALPYDPEAIFEMEDQRNWTDASYKTYVGSLLDPWPYRIEAGTKVWQRIALSFEGSPVLGARTGEDGAATIRLSDDEEGRLPAIGLGLMPAYRRDAGEGGDALAALRPAFITAYAEAGSADLDAVLGDCAALAAGLRAKVQLELILPAGRKPAEALEQAAAACERAGLSPARVLACPAPYLKSIQPVGPWPDVPDLGHIHNQARRAFPDAVILGGMCSYFTELNRKRPPIATIDALSCSTAPIVHAADDRSVMETLEALPAVLASMRAIAPGLPLHIGPSAIGMRHNPYGEATAANPDRARIAMAENDPRQDGLFAAAWSVGYAAAMAEGGVATLALNHLAGPSGVLRQDGGARPVFHVMAALCKASGAARLRLSIPDQGVAGLAWRTADGGTRLLVANLTAEPRLLAFDRDLKGHMLDLVRFAEAREPDWLDRPAKPLGPGIELGAYATLFGVA